jgi:hypothetical protein
MVRQFSNPCSKVSGIGSGVGKVPEQGRVSIGALVGSGMAVGAGIGTALKNVAIGVGIGAGLGLALGYVLRGRRNV